MTLGQVLEHGRDHPTRPAPRRPEIDHYGHGRGRLGRERGAVRVDDPRQSSFAPRAARDSAVDRDDAIAGVATRAADDRHDHQVRARRSSGRLDPPSSASTAVWTHPRRNAKNTGQPVDRDHDHVILDALGHAHERDTGLQAHRCVPIFAGAVTATPPALAPERDGAGRRTESSFRSRWRSRRARSHRVDVSPDPATAANAAAATPPPGEGRARAAPRPPSERRLDCDQRAKASAERRDPALRL